MPDLCKIKYLILDVDGTLTDSGIYYDNDGHEFKKFTTRDYVGVLAAHYLGIKVIIVTGRNSALTQRRADEMHIDYVFQGIRRKSDCIEAFMQEHKITYDNIGYIGDDLNDLASMKPVGFKACPKDACVEIKGICDYVSTIEGGHGVVQDVMRYVLSKMNKWDGFIDEIVMQGY